MRSNTYTFLFTGVVCIGCSFFVSLSAVGLRSRQEVNMKVDVQRNILRSVELPASADERPTPPQIQRLFSDRMTGIVVDTKGALVAGRTPQDVDPEKEPDLLPVFLRKDDGKIAAYTIRSPAKDCGPHCTATSP